MRLLFIYSKLFLLTHFFLVTRSITHACSRRCVFLDTSCCVLFLTPEVCCVTFSAMNRLASLLSLLPFCLKSYIPKHNYLPLAETSLYFFFSMRSVCPTNLSTIILVNFLFFSLSCCLRTVHPRAVRVLFPSENFAVFQGKCLRCSFIRLIRSSLPLPYPRALAAPIADVVEFPATPIKSGAHNGYSRGSIHIF